MPEAKSVKVTAKYCRGLLERHPPAGDVADGSDCITAKFLKHVLEEATPESRFMVSYDPANYEDEEETWDLIGPGVNYGLVFYNSRSEAEEDRDALNRILREHFGPAKHSVAFDSDAHVARCVMDRSCCPACGSEKVDFNEHKFLGGTCTVLRGCWVCNAEWTEVYALQGYKDLLRD